MNELEKLRTEVENLRMFVVNADEVARRRGDEYGLCDSVANDGTPYPSAWSAGIVNELREKMPVTITYDEHRFWELVKP